MTAVDAIETVTNNVVEYGVTVTLDESKGVKLGQSTQVVITTGSKQACSSLQQRADHDRQTAPRRPSGTDDGTTRTVEVVTGLEGDGTPRSSSGLTDGRQS